MRSRSSWEIRSAREAVAELREGNTIAWAPGDATRYELALIQSALPTDRQILVVMISPISCEQKVFLVPQCADWRPRLWDSFHFPPGAYGGIMPILAALGWAPGYSCDYDPLAYQELAKLDEYHCDE